MYEVCIGAQVLSGGGKDLLLWGWHGIASPSPTTALLLSMRSEPPSSKPSGTELSI